MLAPTKKGTGLPALYVILKGYAISPNKDIIVGKTKNLDRYKRVVTIITALNKNKGFCEKFSVLYKGPFEQRILQNTKYIQCTIDNEVGKIIKSSTFITKVHKLYRDYKDTPQKMVNGQLGDTVSWSASHRKSSINHRGSSVININALINDICADLNDTLVDYTKCGSNIVKLKSKTIKAPVVSPPPPPAKGK